MKLHEEWLYKADNDIESAKYLLLSSKPFYDIVVYHAQQCAEKALKAYLVFQKQDVDKTHNLIALVARCKEFSSSFEELKNEIIFLNPYATQFRYPLGELLPSKDETIEAILYAENILGFVKRLIDDE